MKGFIEALNRPADAFGREKAGVSVTLVLLTVLLNSVFEPLFSGLCGGGAFTPNAAQMLKITVFGIAAYFVFCALLWLVCKLFGSGVTLAGHLKAWGVTFYPTALCAIVVAVTETFFYVFWNSTVWGILLNFVFGGILIWKLILFVIYLRKFAELKGARFYAALVLTGVIILALAALEGYLGIKTPVI